MPRGQPEGEQGYTPEVSALDLPRKMVPEIRDQPIADVAGRVGSEVSDTINRKYIADSAAHSGDQIAAARVQSVKTLDDMKANAPAGDPGNFTEQYLAQFDKQTQPLIDAAKDNPIASAMLHKGLRDLRDTLTQHALEWEAKTRSAYRVDSANSNYEAQLPAVTAHPELHPQVMSSLMDQLNTSGLQPAERLAYARKFEDGLSMAAATGYTQQNPRGVLEGLKDPTKLPEAFSKMTEPQLEGFKAKANEQLTRPIFSALEKNDTRGAAAYLKQNQDVMDPKTSWEMSRRIDAQVKEKENEQKQDIADRLNDSIASARMGLPNSIQVTRAEVGLLYPKDPQRHWDALQGIQQAGAMTHQYDKMTPEEITADVAKAKPTEGGPEAALRIEGYDIRARAAEQSLKAREQDPAQFNIQNGAWQPLNFQDPKELLTGLTTRANTQEQVSQQTGVNTPLLSRQEQSTLTQFLGSQPPAQRLTTLTQLRQSMPNDQAYGSLMRQIAPGSPLTAIAGATLDKPAGASWYQPKFAPSPQLGQDILEGDAILAPKKNEKGEMKLSSFPMPKDEDLKPAFAAAIGGSNSDLFRGRADTQAAYYAAFKAVYAAEASKAGRTNGVIDSSMAEQAAEAVIGRATTYGHTNVVVPPGMDPTHFEGAVNAATRASLLAAGYTKQEAGALRGYGLAELGDTLGTGRYVVINGNGDPLKGKDGKSVTIDLNQQHAATQEASHTLTPGFPTHGR